MAVSYPPEGRLLHTPGNQAACQSLHTLAQAQAKQTILEGRTILCTPEHDLQVQLGPFTGVIPREETALGISYSINISPWGPTPSTCLFPP